MIVLCICVEGQKTANAAEWQKQNRINCDTIGTLKKDIKELTIKVSRLRHPLQRPVVIKDTSSEPRKKQSATTSIIVGKASYPIGAKNADDAIFLTDLKITESRKQMDLLRHRFKTRQHHFSRLVEKYRELLANKEAQSQNLGEKPPETLEEDANRKVSISFLIVVHYHYGSDKVGFRSLFVSWRTRYIARMYSGWKLNIYARSTAQSKHRS